MIKRSLLTVLVLGGFCAVQSFADTVLVGMENSLPGSSFEGIGDYNDLIISLSNVAVTSNDGGTFSPLSGVTLWGAQSLNPSPSPFWNNGSLDNPNDNIGYCAEQLANCATGVSGIPAVNEYLSVGGSPDNFFYFTDTGGPVVVQLASISDGQAANEAVVWYATDASGNAIPGEYGLIFNGSPNGSSMNIVLPGGVTHFGLSFVLTNNGENFATNNSIGNTSDSNDSRFALFDSSVPEPGTLALFGIGALVLGIAPRLRRRR